jgi:hypothetical protein
MSSSGVAGSLPLWYKWQHFLYFLPLPQGQGEFMDFFIGRLYNNLNEGSYIAKEKR